jgi:hypothetical protein
MMWWMTGRGERLFLFYLFRIALFNHQCHRGGDSAGVG